MRNLGNISELYKQVQKNSFKRTILNLSEKLGANATMGDYISDFQKSDAPQFKGRTKEQRKKMAIAAYLDKTGQTREEVELDEAIPKSTMYGVVVKGKYIAKGSKQDMLKLAKKTGGQLMNAPGKKVGDSAGKAEEVELDERITSKNFDKKRYERFQDIIGKIKDDGKAVQALMKQLGLSKKGAVDMVKQTRAAYKEELELDEGYSSKEIKMAIGIASDPRYAKGNMTGAVNAIEKIKKGLSTHNQVAAVLKRENENLDEKFTKKDFQDNEDANNHTENGVKLVNMYGTPAEKKLMAQIAKNHDRRGSIEKKEQELRDKLVKKYYPKLESVELDEAFDFVLLDKDNKIVARASGKNAKKDMESSKRSAHLPPMSIPKNEVGKMKIVPISPRDKKDIGDMVLAIGEEVNPITKIINSGKFSETEIKKFIEARDDDDEDDKSAMKNIIMQMRKVVSLRGNFKVEFKDGSKEKLEPRIAQAVQDKFNRMRRADDKEAFMDKISKSKRDLLNALKESINEQKLDEIPALAVPLAIGAIRAAPTVAKFVSRGGGAPVGAAAQGAYNIAKKVGKTIKKKFTKSEEAKSATGYTLFHKSFSDAMQHAYAHAKSKMGMTVDPKEIDSKVATGPKKPGTGKTNKYSLKTNKGMLQIQVYNRGGSKPFELNMYSS